MIRPLYKAVEPFMEVPMGHGFLGVVMYDDAEDKVQCHVCGKYFNHLGKHLAVHDLTADGYKDKFGLTLRTPLCSVKYSAMRRSIMSKNINTGKCSADGLKRLGKAWFHRRHTYITGHAKMQKKNQFGLCDLQIKARYAVVKKICGHVPLTCELKEHDLVLHNGLERKFGSINRARKWLGDNPMASNDSRRVPDIDLIAELRVFRKTTGRIPRSVDFMPGSGRTHNARFYKRFGSWRQALRIAGIK